MVYDEESPQKLEVSVYVCVCFLICRVFDCS